MEKQAGKGIILLFCWLITALSVFSAMETSDVTAIDLVDGGVTNKIMFNHTNNASVVAFGDVDGDGDPDLFAGAVSHLYIYENNGTSITLNALFNSTATINGPNSIGFADVDNDGDLDLAVDAFINSQYSFAIFKNNGTTITNTTLFLDQNILNRTIAFTFGDVDNDGDLDLAAIQGTANTASMNKIYILKNNGINITTERLFEVNAGSGGALDSPSSIAFGDVDNDGDLDLAVHIPNSIVIFENNGTGISQNRLFTNSYSNPIRTRSITFGDVDNDGDLDLAVGRIAGPTVIFENNGTVITNNTLFNWSQNVGTNSITFADVDNDGDLDLIMARNFNGSVIYENNGTTITSNVIFNGSAAYNDGSDVAVGDVDGDGDLELAVAMSVESFVYNNNDADLGDANNVPLPPTKLKSEVSLKNRSVILSWGKGYDVETPSRTLLYNVRVGTCPGCNNIVSGAYGENGENWDFGNGRQVNFRTIKKLKYGKYFWAVQSIDNELKKSKWSKQGTFNITKG